MKGLYIEGGQTRFRSDLPELQPASGEVRVRVLRAGVCATDLALERGYMGFTGVPGHEFVGVALDGPLAGRRVVGEINAGCGVCADCRDGDPRHCAKRTVLGILGRPGAFAEELCLPAANLHPVPEGVSDDAATFAEPLAAAFEIPAQLTLLPGQRALVAGDGRLGLLCAQVLAHEGLEVTVTGRHPERAELLPAAVAYRAGLLESSGGDRWDVVVDATGDPASLSASLARVRPRGTLVLKTTVESGAPIDLTPLVVDEIQLLGSRCGPFPPALAALADGSIRVEPMIHARFPLAQGADALARAGERGTLKVLIEVSER